ncbi:MAG: hypothetical protein DRZ76_01500 [Candidatus Nealsonbacteria bacterium]|nr:MAG: hypothetical protein DRZ76_01500 [Candidatus Nealsonbacteria bacterium]
MAKPEYQKFLTGFKIKKFQKEIEPQEILLDKLSQEKEKELGVSEKQLETPISQKVLKSFWIAILIILFVLFGKTFQLQVMEGGSLSALAEGNKFLNLSLRAERGVIYDRNLKQLVFNKASFDLICDGEVFLEDLSHQDLIFFESRISDFPNCEIKNNTVRKYPEGGAFSHLLGYVRPTGEKTGLEEYYDDFLEARAGQLRVKRDAKGNLISKEIISFPEAGDNLVLWLDSGLQEKVAAALKRQVINTGAEGGAVVALDPKTGGILALSSFPTFDNNLFSQGISQEQWQNLRDDSRNPLFNRAVFGMGYPTGSTIKPLVGLAALEEGIITPEQQIYCPLEICVQNPWDPQDQECYADWKYHGTSDLKRAIAESVNTFFYQIGGGYEDFKGLGATKIKRWLEEFGWSTKTGVDLPKEGKGILPVIDDNWTLGDTYHLSIGQGPFSITPIQVAAAFAAIANGGKLFQPQAVKKVINSEKELVKEMPPKVLRNIPADPENLEVIRQGMRQAVTSPQGSSYLLSSLPVSAAAKTGTAQASSREEIYHNWVTVFAPYEDPQIVLTVVIENVPGIQSAVLPAAREILNWYFSAAVEN